MNEINGSVDIDFEVNARLEKEIYQIIKYHDA